jgi:hypothetical protein
MGERIGVSSRRGALPPLAAAIACGAIFLGAQAGTAGAKVTTVKTTVKITSTSATKFTGKVTASKKACEKGRKVTLYRQITTARVNHAGYPGYEPVGKTTTDANGNWELEAANAFLEGDYRAAVAARKVPFGGGPLECAARWGPTTFA